MFIAPIVYKYSRLYESTFCFPNMALASMTTIKFQGQYIYIYFLLSNFKTDT